MAVSVLRALTSQRQPFFVPPTIPSEPRRVPSRRPYAWLPALIIAMTIVTIAMGVFVLHYLERRLVAATGNNLTLAAAEIADKLDRLLFERYGDAVMTARTFSTRMNDPSFLTAYLLTMKEAYTPVYLWLGVLNADGTLVISTNPDLVGRDWRRQPWFVAARDARSIHVGEPAPYEAVNGLEAVAFTAPVYGDKDEFLGVVSTRVGIHVLENVMTQTIQAMKTRLSGSLNIEYQFLTHAGRVFIDSDLAHKGFVNLKRAGLPSALLGDSGEPGYVEEQHLRRHVPVVTGYARTRGYGDFEGPNWTVLIRMDRDDILSPVRHVLVNIGIAGAVVWLPMFAALLWATGRLRREWEQTQQETVRAQAAEAGRRDSEARTRESEERYRSVVAALKDGVVLLDEAGTVQAANDSAERMLGVSAGALIGWPFAVVLRQVIYEDGTPCEVDMLPPMVTIRTGEPCFGVVLGVRSEKGPVEWLSMNSRPLNLITPAISPAHPRHAETCRLPGPGPAETGPFPGERGAGGVVVSFTDVTVQKRAEQRLRVQHAITEVLAEATTLKEAASKILETICEPLGWSVGILWIVDRQSTILRCMDSWASQKADVGPFQRASGQWTFPSGVGLPGRVWESRAPAWIVDITHDPNFPRLPAATAVGLHAAAAFPILLGGEVEGVLEFFTPDVRDPDDHVLTLMAAIGRQVGHLIERKQLEEQLRQAQKMEAIGRLAGGIAHDFNNLLTVIGGYSEVGLSRLSPTDPLRADLEEIKQAGDRAAALTSQLLAFSRRQVVQPKVVDLSMVVMNLEKMLHRLIGEDVNLVVSLGPSLGKIRIDPGQIEQVILNLVVNARDAMPKGGRLTLETKNVALTVAIAARQVTLQPGSYVTLAVNDTGHGMDEYTQSHMFEPFFTTKEHGKGTGLGLSTVYGIVKQSGADIVVESQPGHGTTFTIFFPRLSERESVTTDAERLPLAAMGGHETLLLVEDEPAIRSLAGDILRQHGYKVLEARHGLEALLAGSQYLGTIQLLITDVIMPQMSGNEVADRMTRERPDLKVLYISGYTDDAIVHHGIVQEGMAFLQKPFTPEALVRKVREVLDGVS